MFALWPTDFLLAGTVGSPTVQGLCTMLLSFESVDRGIDFVGSFCFCLFFCLLLATSFPSPPQPQSFPSSPNSKRKQPNDQLTSPTPGASVQSTSKPPPTPTSQSINQSVRTNRPKERDQKTNGRINLLPLPRLRPNLPPRRLLPPLQPFPLLLRRQPPHQPFSPQQPLRPPQPQQVRLRRAQQPLRPRELPRSDGVDREGLGAAGLGDE